jgi:uncharacterized protein YacL
VPAPSSVEVGYPAATAVHRFIGSSSSYGGFIGMAIVIRLFGALVGTLFGFALGLGILEQYPTAISEPNRAAFLVAMVAATFLFGYLAIPYVTVYPTRWAIEQVAHAGADDFALGVLAIIVGLVMGLLLGVPLASLEGLPGQILPPVASILLAAALLWATLSKKDALLPAFQSLLPGGRRKRGQTQLVVIDTSAVIDGRIADIGRTGFILGTLMVPRFVLDELQRIADSPDALKRNRGRRGLEMLAALQRDSISPVEVTEDVAPEITDVDAKLIALARERGAAILTNDFNLNRVAELQGIRVLNINELANAVKSVLHPGEEFTVRIMQSGKEPGQGVGYLDDGTMIVVEGGAGHIDQDLGVSVTRVLQTVAGRMVFAQPTGATGSSSTSPAGAAPPVSGFGVSRSRGQRA